MTKQELENKIENGESVWGISSNSFGSRFVKTIQYRDINDFICFNLNNLFATKPEAEHYLHHANVTRIETLPFLTWEEFKGGKMVEFCTEDFKEIRLRYDWYMHQIVLELGPYDRKIFDNTEENFYKAYDECVKLFKGE